MPGRQDAPMLRPAKHIPENAIMWDNRASLHRSRSNPGQRAALELREII